MPRPRSTPFPYTTLFRSRPRGRGRGSIHGGNGIEARKHSGGNRQSHLNLTTKMRSEERFSRNAETEIYTLSLHDALPISAPRPRSRINSRRERNRGTKALRWESTKSS